MAEEGHDNVPTTSAETEATGGGIIDTVKSYLGLDSATAVSAQESVTSTLAAAADSVLPESIKPDAVRGAAAAAGNDAPADPSTDASVEPSADKAADPTTDASADSSADKTDGAEAPVAPDPTTDTNHDAEESDKPAGQDSEVGAGQGKVRENPSSIPTAGGQKLGEEHWGESKVVPDNPKPADEDSGNAQVSSAAGQPTDEVKNNTSQNTGVAVPPPSDVPVTATAPPPPATASADVPASETSSMASPARSSTDPEKKGKLMDRLKSKFKKDKP